MRRVALVTVLASLAGCTSLLGIGEPGGSSNLDADAGGADAAAPSVSLAAVPASVRVVRAAQAPLAVALAGPAPAGGVTLELTGLPAMVSAAPITIAAGDSQGSFSIDAAAAATLGAATVTVDVTVPDLDEKAELQLVVADLPGKTDESFGGDGVSVLNIASNADTGMAVGVQSDGKIVVGLSAGGSWRLVRYRDDGTLDPGFGTAGVVTYEAGTLNDLLVLASDKIVAVGTLGTKRGVVRFNPDGTPDDGFGSSAKVVFPQGSEAGTPNRVTVNAAGVLYVAGRSDSGGSQNVAEVFSVSTTGVLGDKAVFPGCTAFTGVGVQPASGQVVVGCSPSSSPQVTLQRYSPAMELDVSFGTAGTATIAYVPTSVADLAVFPDGSLLVSGQDIGAGQGAWVLVRADAGGVQVDLDTGVTPNTPGGVGAGVLALADGRALLTVFGFSSFSGDGTLLRFTAAGEPDASFGAAGVVNFGAGDFTPKHQLRNLAIDRLGRIVAVGSRSDSGLLIVRVWD